MRIIAGNEAIRRSRTTVWPYVEYQGAVTIKGTSFVRGSRVVVYRGEDQVTSWTDTVAEIRLIEMEPGETLTIIPTGTVSVASNFPVDTASQAPVKPVNSASGQSQQDSGFVPDWLLGAKIAARISGYNNNQVFDSSPVIYNCGRAANGFLASSGLIFPTVSVDDPYYRLISPSLFYTRGPQPNNVFVFPNGATLWAAGPIGPPAVPANSGVNGAGIVNANSLYPAGDAYNFSAAGIFNNGSYPCVRVGVVFGISNTVVAGTFYGGSSTAAGVTAASMKRAAVMPIMFPIGAASRIVFEIAVTIPKLIDSTFMASIGASTSKLFLGCGDFGDHNVGWPAGNASTAWFGYNYATTAFTAATDITRGITNYA
jgi:hypothetical protein